MHSIEDFAALLRDELGLSLTVEDVALPFDELPEWDSVHLLWLLTILERTTGRTVPLADVLEASSLADVYHLAVGTHPRRTAEERRHTVHLPPDR